MLMHCSYDDAASGSTLVMCASGHGDVDELAAALDPNRVQYALFRVLETFDSKTSNVKVLHVPCRVLTCTKLFFLGKL